MANFVHFRAKIKGKIHCFYFDAEDGRLYTDLQGLENLEGGFIESRTLVDSKEVNGIHWRKTCFQRFKIRFRNFVDRYMPRFLKDWLRKEVEQQAIASRVLDANENHPQLIEIENRERLGKLYNYLETEVPWRIDRRRCD